MAANCCLQEHSKSRFFVEGSSQSRNGDVATDNTPGALSVYFQRITTPNHTTLLSSTSRRIEFRLPDQEVLGLYSILLPHDTITMIGVFLLLQGKGNYGRMSHLMTLACDNNSILFTCSTKCWFRRRNPQGIMRLFV